MLKPVFALAAAMLTLASCGQPKQVSVDHAWIKLAAVAGHPCAAYFTLHGGPSDSVLIQVSTPAAIKAEMHQTMEQNGMSTMAPLPQVALPAGGTVKFEPGGKHVMLFDVNPSVKPGSKVALRFVFANGQQITADADALAANAPTPKD